ncbi:MAG: maleylpyruvate isomerase family mycothiol-dependent enzyme [Jatrophihabitans sp.]|uniref:maleylpyruvate isomerase family mycothiol-dependent enzyme n=1 Tax=Jatrophihabitans sp. TaxID=1932789 RepID=UPI003F81883E
MDHLAAVVTESDRFRAALRAVDPAARVPSCPDWTAADLLWHLIEVQSFWARVVARRLQAPDEADAARPARPDDWAELLALSGRATAELVDALRSTPPDTPIWTWAADGTVAFPRRFQAHEAMVHRLDAEWITDQVSPVDPALAADGITVLLTHVLGEVPPWAGQVDDPGLVCVRATDTGDAWWVRTGRWGGTSPDTSRTYAGEPFARLADAPATGGADVEVRGRAEELAVWLWGRRGLGSLTVKGDDAALATLVAAAARGVG